MQNMKENLILSDPYINFTVCVVFLLGTFIFHLSARVPSILRTVFNKSAIKTLHSFFIRTIL